MSEEEDVKLTEVPIDDPKTTLSVSEQLLTVHCDFMKVVIEPHIHSCTFLVYQKHPYAKQSERGLVLGGNQLEQIMEIKMSTETAFGTSEYMHKALGEIRRIEDDYPRTFFGPIYIKKNTNQ